jgi:hypothetical protein
MTLFQKNPILTPKNACKNASAVSDTDIDVRFSSHALSAQKRASATWPLRFHSKQKFSAVRLW